MPQFTLRNGAILDTATLHPDSPEGVYFLLDGSLRVFSDGALFDPAAPAAPGLLGSARTLDANLFEATAPTPPAVLDGAVTLAPAEIDSLWTSVEAYGDSVRAVPLELEADQDRLAGAGDAPLGIEADQDRSVGGALLDFDEKLWRLALGVLGAI